MTGSKHQDTRTYAEFMGELSAIRQQPLHIQLAFLRNQQNRERALVVHSDTLNRFFLD